MKATTLRTFLALHTWVGLVAGMGLFIAFYAGAITVFVHELQGWERPAEATPTRAQGLAGAQVLVDRVLARHPEAGHNFYVTLPGEHGPRPLLYWFDEASARQYRFGMEGGTLRQAPARAGFVEFVYDLHFTAGLPRTFGMYLFGVFCVLYGLALVSGVVIYAPGFFKDLFALRLGRNVKRFWQDAHNVVGMLSLPFHVVFAWSGAVLTIGFVLLAPFQALVYQGRLLEILESDFEVAPHVAPAGEARPMLPVAELVRRAERALPGIAVESLSYHDAGDANAQVALSGALPQRRLNGVGVVALNAATGAVIEALPPAEYPPGMAFLRGLQHLHYGDFGAMAIKWLYFLLGMAGAFLFYSGNLLWIEARRKRREVRQPRRTRVMAALTLGVCLGCVAGVSAVFVAAALLPALAASSVYYAVFFLCLGWALLRRPADAANELLWACALLTAAVPVGGAIGSGDTLFAALVHGHWHRFFIDATALLMAAGFWRMAAAVRRRARAGDPHSVWAKPGAEAAGRGGRETAPR
ncbi:PepSY-associated TM helix domain-containing protein [Luteimonas sp. RD2P54]|uniref:PepSY-associated TM helix domain-containing protein n=1 Tax=Luteimonas endophytica TaxID=3042023 RepID=A0ABT6JDT6_9GAMM|nr:PepSY-associated TM helix domain-containing protein [Luteimonas endophytica]MDH5824987.1 PepSY-associated TM helix domain-containing protein [Luteimonas endophytica]